MRFSCIAGAIVVIRDLKGHLLCPRAFTTIEMNTLSSDRAACIAGPELLVFRGPLLTCVDGGTRLLCFRLEDLVLDFSAMPRAAYVILCFFLGRSDP